MTTPPPAKHPTQRHAQLVDLIAQAIADPGSFLPRLPDGHGGTRGESVTRWSTRAVLTALGVDPKFRIPQGLDARPVIRFTAHCSQCGKPAPGYEYDGPCLWAAGDLPKLGDYHLTERDWQTNDGLTDPELEGRALVCPDCWQVGWCETCEDSIHAWQARREGRPGEMWHTQCTQGVDHD